MPLKKDVDLSGFTALYISVFILSTTGLFSKSIPLDALSISQHRSVVAAVILMVFFWRHKQSLVLGSLKTYMGVYGLGVLMGLHWVTYFHAMQVSTVAIGMLSLFSYPVITVLIEPLFQKKLPKITDILAGFIVFIGVLVMVFSDLVTTEAIDSHDMLLGAFWGVLSAVCFSLRNVTQKYAFDHVPSSALMAHQVIAVSLLFLPFVDFDMSRVTPWWGWLLLFLLGLFPTTLGHTLLSMSLKKLPAKTVSIIGCLQPVLGVILAWLVLQEAPSGFVLLGGGIIMLVALFESLKKSESK